MTAGVFNTEIGQGEDFLATLFLRDAVGSKVDLTGCSAAMMVRLRYSDPVPLITLTSSAGLTLGGTAGTIIINIPASATAALVSGQYLYDLKITDSMGRQQRRLQGYININAAVTR